MFVCSWDREIWGRMRWQGWKTASLRRASQRQTKQGCSHWADSEREDDWMWESWKQKAQWLTHQPAGLLKYELDTVWVELCTLRGEHSAHLKAGRGYKVSEHIYTDGLMLAVFIFYACWWACLPLILVVQVQIVLSVSFEGELNVKTLVSTGTQLQKSSRCNTK